jgi:alanine dehydrogenase
MRVGTVREIKNHEYRVGLTPESARELVAHGHEVWVEAGAGLGIGASDNDYAAAGAAIQGDAATVFAGCEMIVKVKEPQAAERALLREGQILYTYLHLAPIPSRPPISCGQGSRRSPTRRSPAPAAPCPCSSR